MSRWVAAAVLVCAVCSCRDIQPFSPSGSISGYRVEGAVTDGAGRGLAGAEVRMFYEFGARVAPLDTSRVMVQNPNSQVEIEVFGPDGQFVRRFTVHMNAGPVPRNIWDEKDSSSSFVENGTYQLNVFVNGSFVKPYPWLVDGKVSAVTDSTGSFAIPGFRLPVGEGVDLYKASGEYDGTYRIDTQIVLEARYSGFQRSGRVVLLRGQITRVSISF
jgi:hypothetical protein